MATGLPKTRWQGDIKKIINESSFFELCWKNESILSQNRLYYGDNLDVLNLLRKGDEFKGKIKLIYIDPPYSTNSVFQTRSLNNGYADLLIGKEYIDFLRQRLILMHELLAEDGSIYIHMDDNMAFHVKILMDEIFGVKNFKNFIVRQKCRSKNFTKKSFGNIADYIIFYTKSDKAIWNKPYEAWSKEKIIKEFPYTDSTGRKYKKVPIHAPGKRNGETGKMWHGMLPPNGKHWQYTPDKLEKMDNNGDIYWSKNGNPRRKVYFDESNGISVQDIWLDYIDTVNQNTQSTGYPTEKNIEMLKRIILASSNEGDYVLDCFCGSGTTLVAASNLNRKWIGVDSGDAAIETTLKRFAHGTTKLGNYSADKKLKQTKMFNVNKLISNFSLFSDAKKSPVLNAILNKWEKWSSF